MRRGLWLACGFALALAIVAGAQNTTELRNTVFDAGTKGNTFKLNDNTVTAVTVTLTNAQIKALSHPTAVTLIAAPASGYFNHIWSVTLSLNSLAGAYTNINATYAALDFTGFSALSVVRDSGASITALSDFLGAAHQAVVLTGAPYVGATGGYVYNFSGVRSTYDAVAFAIVGDNNGSSDWTGGNAANTLKITILYSVEAL